jgi:hypothetical protein
VQEENVIGKLEQRRCNYEKGFHRTTEGFENVGDNLIDGDTDGD